MNLEIKRYSWFEDEKGRNLRYSEYFPYKEYEEHTLCNCTKNITQRPEEDPLSVQTFCTITTENNGRSIELSLNPETWNYTFRWKEKDIIKEDFGYKRDEFIGELHRESRDSAHAYFWRDKNGLFVEISKKDWGLVDYFFGKLLFGNKIDISKLLNGHSPSQIIKVEEIDSMDITAHDCSWGTEAVQSFQEGEEKLNWWKFLSQMDSMNLLIQSHLSNIYPVNESHSLIKNLMTCEDLFSQIKWSTNFLLNILDNLNETNLYSCCTKVYKESHEKDGAFLIDAITGKTNRVKRKDCL